MIARNTLAAMFVASAAVLGQPAFAGAASPDTYGENFGHYGHTAVLVTKGPNGPQVATITREERPMSGSTSLPRPAPTKLYITKGPNGFQVTCDRASQATHRF